MSGPERGSEIGWGKFVLLYDPAGQHGWAGQFRIIAYVRADLDPEIAADPLIGEVGWSWLIEALDAWAAGYRQTSGTVTRVVTEGFGAKQDEPTTTEFELRASWSPPGGPLRRRRRAAARGSCVDGHVAAWCDALCMAAGLPPVLRGSPRCGRGPQAAAVTDRQATGPGPAGRTRRPPAGSCGAGSAPRRGATAPAAAAPDAAGPRPARRRAGAGRGAAARAARRPAAADRHGRRAGPADQALAAAAGRSRSTPSGPRASATGTGPSWSSCAARARAPC